MLQFRRLFAQLHWGELQLRPGPLHLTLRPCIELPQMGRTTLHLEPGLRRLNFIGAGASGVN